jgi:flagellar biosynthetic protein FliR
MALATLLSRDAAVYALVACRLAGFVVTSPFPGSNVSATQRVGLVVVLSWVAFGFAPADGAPSVGVPLVGQGACEVGCGLIIGMAFRFVFSAADVLGGVLGQTTGLGSASVLNPTFDVPETAIERIVTLVAMLIALGVGAHRIALASLLSSFRVIPVGRTMALDASLLPCLDLGIDAFCVGVRLATPVLAVALLTHVTLALIARAAPALQIFNVGFAILFASTIATLLAGIDDVAAGLGSQFGRLAAAIDVSLAGMRP